MAYMGYCILCNHMKADVSYYCLLEYFLDHTAKSHSGQLDSFVIMRIRAEEYQDFLKHKDNPNFWKAWNNKAKVKPENIPFFVRVSGENEPFVTYAK